MWYKLLSNKTWYRVPTLYSCGVNDLEWNGIDHRALDLEQSEYRTYSYI